MIETEICNDRIQKLYDCNLHKQVSELFNDNIRRSKSEFLEIIKEEVLNVGKCTDKLKYQSSCSSD